MSSDSVYLAPDNGPSCSAIKRRKVDAVGQFHAGLRLFCILYDEESQKQIDSSIRERLGKLPGSARRNRCLRSYNRCIT